MADGNDIVQKSDDFNQKQEQPCSNQPMSCEPPSYEHSASMPTLPQNPAIMQPAYPYAEICKNSAQNPADSTIYSHNYTASPYATQPVVVVTQPTQYLEQVHPPLYVPDQMGFSIFTTFCCCICLGIPAMMCASEANKLKYVDPERALSKANTARSLNIAAVVFGVIILGASVALRMVG